MNKGTLYIMSGYLKQWSATPWVYAVAFCLGLMQAFVFDFKFNSSFVWLASLLSFVSLGGFLALLKYLAPRRAALFGYVFGLGVFAWGLNWIYISMARFGGAPFSFAIAANVVVVAYLALYWLVAAYAITKLGKTPNLRLLIAPAVIALLEWLRSVFLIGFPWLSVGYGFIDSVLSSFAAIGGVFFVSFLAVLLVALLLLDTSVRYACVRLVVAFCIGVMVPISLATKNVSDKTVTVTLVQGNMPVITEYDEARMTQNLVQYMKLTDAALAESVPDVMIWAESAIPYFYVEVKDFLGSIHDEQRAKGFDLITGIPHGDWLQQQDTIYNSILLQRADNPEPQFYNKQHLLPFGEYLPFRAVFAFFKDFVEIPMSDFARGQVVQKPFVAGGVVFSPSICFEAVFGDEVRRNAQNTDILLNISNDAWFGRSKAQAQHLNIARMRAIENQKPMVRATNDGLTAVIGTDGGVQKSLPPFNEGFLTTAVRVGQSQTLYAKLGDIWLVLCFLWLLIVRRVVVKCK